LEGGTLNSSPRSQQIQVIKCPGRGGPGKRSLRPHWEVRGYNIYNISVMKTKMYINIGSSLYLEIIKILNFASKEVIYI
jgi:hypothetical protein